MRIALKLLGLAAAALLLAAIISAIAVYRLIRVGEVGRFFTAQIERETGLHARFGASELEFGWISGVGFSDVALSESADSGPFLTARRVTARIALRPLLRRQLLFYEIRLTQPAAHFVRERDGGVPLLDRLLNLPFFKEQEESFGVDLRSIQVREGEIALVNHRRDGQTEAWRATQVDLDIERLSGTRLGAAVRAVLKGKTEGEDLAALAFHLRGTLARQGATMDLKASGQLAFPEKRFSLQRAHWNGEIALVNFPASLFIDLAGDRLPVKSMNGYVAHRVRIEGNPSTLVRASGSFEFRQLSVEAPELFSAPLSNVDARVTFALERKGTEVQLRQAEIRSKDISLSMQGKVTALESDDPQVRLTFSAAPAPAAALSRYLPLKLFHSARLDDTLAAIQAGTVELKRAGVDSTLSGLRKPGAAVRQISGEVELRELIFRERPSVMPLRVAHGRLDFNEGILRLGNFRGTLGGSRVSRLDAIYDVAGTAPGTLKLEGQGEIDLAELQEQSRLHPASERLAKMLGPLEDLEGRAKVDLTLRQAPDHAVQFDAKMQIERARLRYGELVLTEARGEFSVTPERVAGERIAAQLSGSPIRAQLRVEDYAAPSGVFDLRVESPGMKAGVLARLLLNTGSPQDPGVVRGSVRYFGSLQNSQRRNLTGELELAKVQLLFSPLLQPLRELQGRIRIDESGIDFEDLNALLVGVPARASGRWRYAGAPQLTFDFVAPNLDLTYLISQIDPESSPFYANLIAEGKIALAKGRIKNFEFGDLQAGVTLSRRVWRLTNVRAGSAGGTIRGTATIFDRPDTLGIEAEPRLEGVPVQSFLRWFDATTDMTGAVTLAGQLETVGKNDLERKQNLAGAFHLNIRDGTIRRMRILVRILNLLDLSRWFTLQLPDLTKDGIRFRAITGDFKVANGVYATDNLLVDSNDLRMTGAGKIDVPKDEVDFIVAVRPFAGVDTALNYIPLIGRGVAAIKNSFLVASFSIRGPIENPTITPAPLSTMSEWFWGVLGIPKNLIGLGESDGREQPGSKQPAR